MPELAGMGQAPHNLADAASERMRSGLSPKTTSISAAVSGPTPNAWRMVGATSVVSPSRWRSASVTSVLRASHCRNTVRKLNLADAVVSTSLPTRKPAQRAKAAGKVSRDGSNRRTRAGDLALEFVGSDSQLPAAEQELSGDAGHRPGHSFLAILDLGHDVIAPQCLGRDLKTGEEFVEVPAQPALNLGPLFDQVIAVIHQETQLSSLAVELDDGEVGFAHGRPGDSERINGIGLTLIASTMARFRHQTCGNPQGRLAGDQQVSLETPGEMPTVLEGEDMLGPARTSAMY